MGADLERIDALTAIREGGRERPLSLATDIEQLERALTRIETEYDRCVRLVVIDPVTAYLGKGTDSHVDADVRGVLAPLAQLAERHGCALVTTQHLNKAPAARALYRPGGSIAFVATARSVLAVTTDPDVPDSARRFLVPLKMNLAPKPPTLGFAVGGIPPRLEWEAEPVLGVDAESAIRGPVAEESDARSEREEARIAGVSARCTVSSAGRGGTVRAHPSLPPRDEMRGRPQSRAFRLFGRGAIDHRSPRPFGSRPFG